MAAINAVTDLTVEDGIAVLTIDSPPVNALSLAVREGIQSAVKQAVGNPEVQGIVLMCAGRTFIAGADITEFDKPPQPPSLYDVEDALEGSPKPVIAAIHGTALGGGLEVALCCHYRVAVPSARCGLPEVHLGLVPGAGGTQRLPRIVGPEKALEMITSGRHVDARTCLQLGLIDDLVGEGALRAGAIAFARKVLAEKMPLRKIRDVDDNVLPARGRPELFAEFREANARKFRGFLAPEYAIRCIEAAVNLPFEEGLAVERELFEELLQGPQSAAQRYIFFAERQVWKVPDLAPDTPTVPVTRVGIVGAGTMGGGIAMSFANAGTPVTVVETSEAALERGLGIVRRNYEFSVRRGRLSLEDVERRMALIQGTSSLQQLADCDLVIEAVFEDMQLKKEVFARLDDIVKQGAILATNTSGLNVDEIATAVRRPEAVIGLHFFSPAHVMRLIEVVRARRTSNTAVATALQLAKTLGKVPVVVGVCPGFVGNRMLFARQRQAEAMLLEGALPWDIDRVLYEFGLPMGPFAMADLAGLDIGWNRQTSTGATLRDALCEMGRLGQKTGAGWYDYDENRTPSPSPVTEQLVRDFMARHGATPRQLTDAEILERCLYPMINEGARILEEGIALRPSDIDVVWVNGYGWPAYRGGPMFYADSVGLATVVARLAQYAPKLGPEFKLSPLLERLAAAGQRFQDLK